MLFKENITGQEADIKTEFSIKREGNILHCFYKAFDTSFYSASKVDNGNLFDGDVVEIFIYIGEKDSYLEIEVAPNGTTFVANITNRKIDYIDNSFVKAQVERKEKDYFVSLDIDLSRFNVQVPIEYNAFRIERENGEVPYRIYALNPTLCGTFHVRDKFIFLK